jgi:hypothetical protein
MKKILIALGLCAALGVQAAIINNASFETGSTANWSTFNSWFEFPPFVVYPDGSPAVSGTPPAVSVVTYASPGPGSPFYGPSSFYNPDSGGVFFAAITATTPSTHQGLAQTFTLSSSETMYGWFAASGGATAFVNILSSGASVYNNNTTSSSWTEWSTTLGPGTYTLAYSVYGGIGSKAYFDMSVVPEPRGWLMGGALLGMLGVGEFLRRRRAQKANA